MKKLFKGLQRIKWENIAAIAMVALSVCAILDHIKMNGFYSMLFAEIAIYGIACVGIRYIVKDIRTNPTNWLIDIDK